MSTVAKIAAPKSYNQLRLVATFVVGLAGCYAGNKEKKINNALWTEHFKAQWAAKAKVAQDKADYERSLLPPAPVHEAIPVELHDVVKALKGN
jgi:hypothetical protein